MGLTEEALVFEFDEPSDRRSIAAALERLESEIADYFAELSVEEFLAPQGEAWSPCGHLRHLVKSVVPVAGASAASTARRKSAAANGLPP